MSKAGFARSKVIGAIICKLSEIRYLRYYPNVKKERLVKSASRNYLSALRAQLFVKVATLMPTYLQTQDLHSRNQLLLPWL